MVQTTSITMPSMMGYRSGNGMGSPELKFGVFSFSVGYAVTWRCFCGWEGNCRPGGK